MKVVFLQDVPGVAHGGDVKEVKNGFARNYLIPKQLAVPATHNALQRINSLRKQAETTRMKVLSDMRALAQQIDGTQINIEMRSAVGGRLYGSVTSAIIAERLAQAIGREVERRTIELAEPIRQLGVYDVNVSLHPEVEAAIKVVVHATGTDPSAMTQPAAEEATDQVETAEAQQSEEDEEDQEQEEQPA